MTKQKVPLGWGEDLLTGSTPITVETRLFLNQESGPKTKEFIPVAHRCPCGNVVLLDFDKPLTPGTSQTRTFTCNICQYVSQATYRPESK